MANQTKIAQAIGGGAPPPPSSSSLTPEGWSRWAVVKEYVPFSREQARLLEIAGRFPPRTQLSPAITAWANRQFLIYLADPAAYRAPVSDAEPVIGHKRAARAAPSTSENPVDPIEARRHRFEKLRVATQAKKAKAKSVEPKAERSTLKPVPRPAKNKPAETA